jgi:[calcium/calmodulin-dependent protein kinase] kinase
LNHPNIVRLWEIIDDDEDEKLHMIMDFCEEGQILSFNEDKMNFTPC